MNDFFYCEVNSIHAIIDLEVNRPGRIVKIC